MQSDFQQPADHINGEYKRTWCDTSVCYINFTREQLMEFLQKQMNKFSKNDEEEI